MPKVWVKANVENEQAFKVSLIENMDIDDMKEAIVKKRRERLYSAGAIEFIFHSNSNTPFEPSYIIPIPENGTIGSDKLPYIYSVAQIQSDKSASTVQPAVTLSLGVFGMLSSWLWGATTVQPAVSQCSQYSCHIIRGRTVKTFRANLFRLAEAHIASTREGVPTDGVNKVGKNITISLIFKSENNLARFQSEVIELMSVVAGHKRPHIEVDEATVPHELVLWREQTECISVDSVKLSRVFKYQYQHDSTADDPDNSAECDGYSDVASLRSVFGEYVNIADPEVRFQMIEDPYSDYWNSMSPEAAHIKDKAKCNKKDKTDKNNFIYMSRFLHCYFDGLNANPPKFPSMKIHYVKHDAVAISCSTIWPLSPLGLEPRYRVVVRLIFFDINVRKYAMAFLRGGGTDIDLLTYELDLYFQDATKAVEFLKWKEDQTEKAWTARNSGMSVAEVADVVQIDSEEEVYA